MIVIKTMLETTTNVIKSKALRIIVPLIAHTHAWVERTDSGNPRHASKASLALDDIRRGFQHLHGDSHGAIHPTHEKFSCGTHGRRMLKLVLVALFVFRDRIDETLTPTFQSARLAA